MDKDLSWNRKQSDGSVAIALRSGSLAFIQRYNNTIAPLSRNSPSSPDGMEQPQQKLGRGWCRELKQLRCDAIRCDVMPYIESWAINVGNCWICTNHIAILFEWNIGLNIIMLSYWCTRQRSHFGNMLYLNEDSKFLQNGYTSFHGKAKQAISSNSWHIGRLGLCSAGKRLSRPINKQ